MNSFYESAQTPFLQCSETKNAYSTSCEVRRSRNLPNCKFVRFFYQEQILTSLANRFIFQKDDTTPPRLKEREDRELPTMRKYASRRKNNAQGYVYSIPLNNWLTSE